MIGEPRLVLQLILLAFALFALSRAYLRYQERKLSVWAMSFWIAVWLIGSLAVFYPDLTTQAARFVGIGRGVDAVLYGSIAVLFYLIFRLYIRIEDIQRQMTELIRKLTLKKLKPPRNSSKR